jgi:hypothetical protein
MLAIFLVRGVRTQKNGLKTHLSKVSDGNAPKISQQASPSGPDLCAQINGTYWIPDPPHLSTFKRGGGGPESGAHLSNGPDQCAQINGDKDHSGPPPAFLPLSGGGGVRNRRCNF